MSLNFEAGKNHPLRLVFKMRHLFCYLQAKLNGLLVSMVLCLLVVAPVFAQFELDVDDDGRTEPLTDGLLILRHLFGFTGIALTSGALGAEAQRTDPEDIGALLDETGIDLDIDDDGVVAPLTDGLLILRALFGFSGDALIKGAISEAGRRQTATEVVTHLQGFKDFKNVNLESESPNTEQIQNIETEYLQIVEGVTIRVTEKIDATQYEFVEIYEMAEGTERTFKAPEGYKVAKAIAYVDKWPPEERCSMDISVPISMYTLGLSEFTINADPALVGDPCPGPKTWHFTFGYVKNDVEIDIAAQINRQEPKLYEIRQFLQDTNFGGYTSETTPLTQAFISEFCKNQNVFTYEFDRNLLDNSGEHKAALWTKNIDDPDTPSLLDAAVIQYQSVNEKTDGLILNDRLSYLELPEYTAPCLGLGETIELSIRVKIPQFVDAQRPLISNMLDEDCRQTGLGVCFFLTPPEEGDELNYYNVGFYSGNSVNGIAGFKFFAQQTPLYPGVWYDLKLVVDLNATVPSVSIIVDGAVNKFTNFPAWDGDPKLVHEYLFSDEAKFQLFGVRNGFNEAEENTDIPILVDSVTVGNPSIIQESEEINKLLQELIVSLENNALDTSEVYYQDITALFKGEWAPVSEKVVAFLTAVENREGSIYAPAVKTNIKTLSFTKQLAHFFKEWIFDKMFTADEVMTIEGLSFKELEVFPGSISENAELINRTVAVDGTYKESPGYHINNDETVLRPTGTYAPPGQLVTLKLPKEILDKGWQVQVGIHGGNLACWSETRRFNRIANTFPLDKTTVHVANPFGGGLYIIVPSGSDAGVVDILIENAVNLPTLSTFDLKGMNTSLAQFQADIQSAEVPWFEIVSDKFNLTYPLEYSANYENPIAMLDLMGRSLDEVMLMAGRPTQRVRAEWLVVDAQIIACGTAMAASYPTYGDYDGSPSIKDKTEDGLWFSPFQSNRTYWHEMGHLHNLPTLGCQEQESNVHLLKAVIDSNVAKLPIDTALQNSGFQPFTRLDAAFDLMFTVDWQVEERVCGENDVLYGGNQMRYQTKSWARTIELADLYGWEAVGKSHNVFYEKNIRNEYIKDYEISDDEFVYRSSFAVGVNLAPIFDFWGIPVDPNIKNGLGVLPSPVEFLDRLNLYKNAIPKNEGEYQARLKDLRSGVGQDQFFRIDYWIENYSAGTLEKMHERIDKIALEIKESLSN